jgi:hypothetical protein
MPAAPAPTTTTSTDPDFGIAAPVGVAANAAAPPRNDRRLNIGIVRNPRSQSPLLCLNATRPANDATADKTLLGRSRIATSVAQSWR